VGVDPIVHLLSMAALGQQEAFAHLYDALAPLVHGVVLRIVGDLVISEEVTHEVFVGLWRHAARFDERAGSVHAWACTIAHRQAVDRLRSEQRSLLSQEVCGVE
jgi:RNA polymerase sigma-70 factor (ECF subfamily)